MLATHHFSAKGLVLFDNKAHTTKQKQQSWKKYVFCNIWGDIDAYYRWHLYKRFGLVLNPPQRRAHITIVNEKVNDRLYYLTKKQYNKTKIKFQYSTKIETNGEYWWLVVHSDDILNLRKKMALSPKPYWKMHITLGVPHPLYVEQSHYAKRQMYRF